MFSLPYPGFPVHDDRSIVIFPRKIIRIYMLTANYRSARRRCEICSKLTIKTRERSHWYRCGIFIVNFECILHLVL